MTANRAPESDLRAHVDFADNERAAFTGFRVVRERYEIAPGGIVIASGGIARLHAPIAHPELPQMVAKLETATDAAILKFYETYGALDFLAESSNPDDHFYTWPDGKRTESGDPLPWVRSHARTVRVCLALSEGLTHRRVKELQALTTDPTPGYAVGPTIGTRSAARLLETARIDYCAKHGITLDKPLSVTTRARLLRRCLINPNIAGIHRYVDVSPDGTDRTAFTFRGQIEAVYWHLANIVDGGVVARCKRPGCGGLFTQRHRSQEYCAPRYRQRESPCALWVRQRRLGNPAFMESKKGQRSK
jgi:hypothetical protein